MKRHLLNLLTASSLLLCVGICVPWARSLSVTDSLCVRGPRGALVLAISRNNAVEVIVVRDWPVSFPPRWASLPADRGSGYEALGPNSFGSQPKSWHVLLASVGGWSADLEFPRVVGRSVVNHVRPAWCVQFDYWLAAALAAVLPGVRGFRRLWGLVRDRHSSRAGRCRFCGYDLRATPGRCPECGTAASVSASG